MRQTPAGATTALTANHPLEQNEETCAAAKPLLYPCGREAQKYPGPKNPGRPINFQAIGTFEPVAFFSVSFSCGSCRSGNGELIL